MTNQPTRADWWREVTDPDEVIPAGCPARAEWPGYAYEAYESVKTADRPARFLTYPLAGIRVFIDTRWTPPTPPLAVGDVIETVEDLERLPEGTLLFSTQLHAYWMEKEGHFVAIGSDRWLVADEAASYGPFTIRWLPEPEVTA